MSRATPQAEKRTPAPKARPADTLWPSASELTLGQRLSRSVATRLKWLRPGLRVKRWLVVVVLGILLLTFGIDLVFLMQLADLGDSLNRWMFYTFGVMIAEQSPWVATYQVVIGVPLAALGLLITAYGVVNMLTSVHTVLTPAVSAHEMVDTIWRRRQLTQGYRIAVLGGGTGLSTLLRGLKEYSSNITAVVTVTDDGGSSGRLQRDLNMPPPGDIRNCLVALADASPLMEQLFEYRFTEGGESLEGHSFGNLLIAAMLNVTGDFETAVRASSRVLNIRGRVVPSTLSRVSLVAELENGETVEGETTISQANSPIRKIRLSDSQAEPLEETIRALRTADAIIIGPGSVYTSVIPNFLVKGVAEAVAASKALKIYVCNVMTQPGETTGFTASQHARVVLDQAGAAVFDYVLVNDRRPSEELLERYASTASTWVEPDADELRAMGLRPVVRDLISETDVVRHDAEKLARAITDLMKQRVRPTWWPLDRRR